MTSTALLCDIYGSTKHEAMYLYVAKETGLEPVPEDLLNRFGESKRIMTLLLTPEKKLARANAQEVMSAIQSQGFYLQMPPTTHHSNGIG